MADKSELVPHQPMAAQGGERGPTNLSLYPERYYLDGKIDATIPAVIVPSFVTAMILDKADASDPNNQLRVFCVRVAKRLAYKFTLAESLESHLGVEDTRRLMLAAFFLLGAEHSAEIRDAIAAEREAAR